MIFDDVCSARFKIDFIPLSKLKFLKLTFLLKAGIHLSIKHVSRIVRKNDIMLLKNNIRFNFTGARQAFADDDKQDFYLNMTRRLFLRREVKKGSDRHLTHLT